MTVYIIKRILMLVPILFGVSLLVYSILYLSPGDPAALVLGEQATAEQIATKQEEMGLNDPFIVQYFNYMKGYVTGDFGVSYKTGRPVSEEIFAVFPNTVILTVSAMAIALLIALPTGIIAATKQYSILDNVTTILALLGVSMPNFWLGLMLIAFIAVNVDFIPTSQMNTNSFPELVASLILPAITLGTGGAAIIMRMTRSSMLEVVRQDYIRTARAKGVSEKKVIRKHALSNALIPIVTVVGLQFGYLLGGAVLTETVFAWPGMGKYMVDAIKTRDIPVVLAAVIFMAVVFTVVNLLVDILYAFLDPRIKAKYKKG
ncbi:MAG: ABC transporter permease [Bacilli bacterium]